MILNFIRYQLLSIFIILLTGQILTGCRDTTKATGGYILEGRMVFRDLEGGCWQLIDGNNRSYEIVGKDTDQLHVDGLAVKLLVRDRDNIASICMVGIIVELIEIIETSQSS